MTTEFLEVGADVTVNQEIPNVGGDPFDLPFLDFYNVWMNIMTSLIFIACFLALGGSYVFGDKSQHAPSIMMTLSTVFIGWHFWESTYADSASINFGFWLPVEMYRACLVGTLSLMAQSAGAFENKENRLVTRAAGAQTGLAVLWAVMASIVLPSVGDSVTGMPNFWTEWSMSFMMWAIMLVAGASTLFYGLEYGNKQEEFKGVAKITGHFGGGLVAFAAVFELLYKLISHLDGGAKMSNFMGFEWGIMMPYQIGTLLLCASMLQKSRNHQAITNGQPEKADGNNQRGLQSSARAGEINASREIQPQYNQLHDSESPLSEQQQPMIQEEPYNGNSGAAPKKN